jgi:hypothetical protein
MGLHSKAIQRTTLSWSDLVWYSVGPEHRPADSSTSDKDRYTTRRINLLLSQFLKGL